MVIDNHLPREPLISSYVPYTPTAVVIDNHLPREPLISSYVPDWPLPPHVYIPSESEMALQARITDTCRLTLRSVAILWRAVCVCDWSVWRLKCFSSNLVHLYKRYGVKWVTCIRAFDVRNDFPAYQVTCYSGFGLSERQILFSDVK